MIFFRESTAPIVTLNLVNTLQLLAKTMVIFLQRCECGETNRERIAEFCTLIRTGLDEKGIRIAPKKCFHRFKKLYICK